MSDENLVLAGDFPAASYEEWHEAVDKALKGAPFEKKMVTRTYEGITIHPIYTRRDWLAEGDPSGFPGTQPFSRGFNAAGREGWCVRQEQAASDPKVANAAILADLEHGATSLVLRLDRAARAGLDPDKAGIESAGVDGIMAYSLADFDDVLNKVRFDVVPIALVTGAQFIAGAALLAALWQKQGVTNDKAKGAFNADPLGILAETGTLSVPVETALAQMADLAAYTARTWPHVTAVGVDTTPYDDAGATETQNLACAMATAVTYLRTMTGAGMDVNAACRQISFTFPVSCDFFLSIAKLRAARKMWARITESCGATGEACAARIHARTAERMITRCDPWVNMLRTTTAAFAAGIAGANSVTALPFDYALGQSDDSAQRIARNGQIILREESSLTKVIDPAGGAWYVESLTDQLARIAWELFQTIEKAGGMAKALGNGTIADQIASVWATREKNIAHRRDPIAGVSEFPNITEVVPVRPSPDHKALLEKARTVLPVRRAEAAAALGTARLGSLTETAIAAAAGGATIGSMAAVLASPQGGAVVKALPKHRLSESFEALRDAADTHKAKTGAWPAIFLANLGSIAAHNARATYAKNFFETGGIQALTNNGFTTAETCVAAFKDSEARIAILCSSDILYEEHVARVAPALKAAGCALLFLAGNPGDRKQGYMNAGVDNFIFMGCDVLGTLRAALARLGVTQP